MKEKVGKMYQKSQDFVHTTLLDVKDAEYSKSTMD